MLDTVAAVIVLIAAGYFLTLGVVALRFPTRAEAFLGGLATSPLKHYLELVLRLAVGLAFVRYAPRAELSSAFRVFGLVLISTTIVLFLVPWSWHQRFAQAAVPRALRFLKSIGLVSFAIGLLIIASVFRAAAPN